MESPTTNNVFLDGIEELDDEEELEEDELLEPLLDEELLGDVLDELLEEERGDELEGLDELEELVNWLDDAPFPQKKRRQSEETRGR